MDNIDMIQFIIEYKFGWISFIGALLVAYGAFHASVEQKKSEKRAEALSKKLQLETEEVKRLTQLTIKLQDESIKALKNQTNLMTGGDSFPVVAFYLNPAPPGYLDLKLINTGHYPLYELKVAISDIHLMQEIAKSLPKFKKSTEGKNIFLSDIYKQTLAGKHKMLNSAEYTKSINIGEVKPLTITEAIERIKIPDDGDIWLSIALVARNCVVQQRIRVNVDVATLKIKLIENEVLVNGKEFDPQKAFDRFPKGN